MKFNPEPLNLFVTSSDPSGVKIIIVMMMKVKIVMKKIQMNQMMMTMMSHVY